jgi:anhydro-N-acetylmuramic acid kinase
MGDLYVGLISGTSLDGVDAVLADFGERRCAIRAAATTRFPPQLQDRLRTLIERPQQTSLAELGTLDSAVGEFFADCTLALLRGAGSSSADVVAIGHHGQTVFHQPEGPNPFSMQLGNPNVLAARTGITTIADFRRLDMALGGQGAPLMPGFHEWCFEDAKETRAVVNIGGIANVTLLHPNRPLEGFDTGPGNTLLDAWIQRNRGEAFDRGGSWAASGAVDPRLLEALLAEPFFERAPPKSTGREYFNLAWLEQRAAAHPARRRAEDVQATLAELSAVTIAGAIGRLAPGCARLILCGGGAHNADLVERLRQRVPAIPVESSREHGLSPDWVEAAGFAWLARQRLAGKASNRPTVTGARLAAALGGVYLGVDAEDA